MVKTTTAVTPSRCLQPTIAVYPRALNFEQLWLDEPIYRSARRNRSALPITETELKVIAALAIIGLSSSPNHG